METVIGDSVINFLPWFTEAFKNKIYNCENIEQVKTFICNYKKQLYAPENLKDEEILIEKKKWINLAADSTNRQNKSYSMGNARIYEDEIQKRASELTRRSIDNLIDISTKNWEQSLIESKRITKSIDELIVTNEKISKNSWIRSKAAFRISVWAFILAWVSARYAYLDRKWDEDWYENQINSLTWIHYQLEENKYDKYMIKLLEDQIELMK